MMIGCPLRIAYVLQTGVPEMDVVSGPLLHIQAVIDGLRNRGHHVRVFMPRNGHLGSSGTLNGFPLAANTAPDECTSPRAPIQ